MRSLALFVVLLSQLMVVDAHAQRKRLDLEDISIKGELYSDDRLNLLSRQENELKNYVKFRTNYRSEIIEELPQPRPGSTNRR